MASKRIRPRGDVESSASGSKNEHHSLVIDCEGDTKPTPSSAPTKQWTAYFSAVLAVNRFKNGHHRLQEAGPVHEETTDRRLVGSSTDNHEVNPTILLECLRMVHGGLVQQLNTCGILLILLAGIMSVAILQPPGSFDPEGHIRISPLVACYLLFASLAFLLACTGLFAVIAGAASLFRPRFFADPHGSVLELQDQASVDSVVRFDSITTLQEIVQDNMSRVRRLKTYLGFSLGLCMIAFVCGAFAVLGPVNRNLWMTAGTMVVGGSILAF